MATLVVSPAASQTSPPAAERSQRAFEAFLSREEAQQARRAQKFASPGQPDITGQVRAIVASAGVPPPNRAGASPEQLQRLRAAFDTEVAQKLVQLGFNPGDLQKEPAAAPAAARLTRGEHSVQDLGILADLVVVGTVSGVQNSKLADPYLSTVTFSNLRILKGAAPGATLRIRQESGMAADGHRLDAEGDIHEVGKTYALFLSSHLYNALASGPMGPIGRGSRRPGADLYYLPFGAWYEVLSDGRLVAQSPGMPQAETVDALAAAIK